MAVTGDVTVAQNGGQGNAKLHPYLVTIVRWCLSCVWGTATLFLHRLITAPLPAITASKPPPKPRAAGTDHLHPEPRVQCEVLHEPANTPWNLDVIFVHGLYGSLGNTWRQGDWRSKYKLDPTRVPLRDHTTNSCSCGLNDNELNEIYECETTINERATYENINERLKKILPNENLLITEQFYNNTLEIFDDYDARAKFVEDLFKNENQKSNDLECRGKNELNGHNNRVDGIKCKINDVKCNLGNVNKCKCDYMCGVGCGCVCDHCYSSCWPKDWIKEDFPGARVISINYTSDPYLWRPLWVKESKRLRLHERAEQMIEQLLALRVGQRPIIWVGHSKGGLFIKQIYCEAYEAYLKTNKHTNKDDIKINMNSDKYNRECENNNSHLNKCNDSTKYDALNGIDRNENGSNECVDQDSDRNNNMPKYNDNCENINNIGVMAKGDSSGVINDILTCDSNDKGDINYVIDDENNIIDDSEMLNIDMPSKDKEDIQEMEGRCSLWHQSTGFMFYSVPHRGSPLADIKTPITARSVELLEIAKDCPLVLDLHARWLIATESSRPQVRSLVETCRTLMSVLWLRIVSVDSADAGVGALHGVSVDHREICKPSSRNCLLYTELMELIRNSLKKCECLSEI